ncbi:hypothetical protein [Nocardia beijingensis]|uniref:Uncharacterized protein n=1 Tax=Nocardia beijingensis TaxID=95162 RepID=A0ABW7WDT2_9NOCA
MPCCLLAGYLAAGAHRLWRRLRGRSEQTVEFPPTAYRAGPAAAAPISGVPEYEAAA